MRIYLSALLLLFFTAGPGVQASDLIEKRKAQFKNNVTILRAIRNHLAGNDFNAIAKGAEEIAIWATNMPDYFPAGSASKAAAPAIWQNFDDFKAKAQANHDAALALKTAAQSQNPQSVMNAVQNLGGTCKSCHSSYKLD